MRWRVVSPQIRKRVTDARGEQLGRTMKTVDYPSTLYVQQGPKDMANASLTMLSSARSSEASEKQVLIPRCVQRPQTTRTPFQ